MQAHKKLGDLHRRWVQANRLLAPTVDSLPQLLIIPVVLFIVGLLDNLLSSLVPLSSPFVLILVAAIVSCASAIAVAVYTIWTVAHGCMHPDRSPFQSTLSEFILFSNDLLAQGWKVINLGWSTLLRKARALRAGPGSLTPHSPMMSHPIPLQSLAVPTTIADLDIGENNNLELYKPNIHLTEYEHEAFHIVLQETHEDDVLDQAVAALPSLIRDRLETSNEHYNLSSVETSAATDKEFLSLSYMLSAEASIQSSIAAANLIVDSTGTFSISSSC